jgi:hypothetical protein
VPKEIGSCGDPCNAIFLIAAGSQADFNGDQSARQSSCRGCGERMDWLAES